MTRNFCRDEYTQPNCKEATWSSVRQRLSLKTETTKLPTTLYLGRLERGACVSTHGPRVNPDSSIADTPKGLPKLYAPDCQSSPEFWLQIRLGVLGQRKLD
jgi:hypothetical protein